MKRILCPTDFSSTADNAVVFAAKLAKKLDATLHLFNAQILGDLTPESALLGVDLNVSAAEAQLEQRCLEISKVFKISCYGEVGSSAGSLINELGRESSVHDLVVMGTNGEDDLFQKVFGSNTYRLINKRVVPVLVVPENCGYGDIENIVYAFDYWRENNLALAQIVSFAEKLGSSLTILQVMEKSYSHKADEEIRSLQKMIMEVYGDRVAMDFQVVHNDDISEGIDNFFSQSEGDLLALCSQNYGFLGKTLHSSVIKALSKRVDYPLMVVHR